MSFYKVFAFFFLLFLSPFTHAQNIEKIIFDTKDTTDGYYLAITPSSKNIKGVLVLLTSFMSPEALLPETKLHNVAFANDILTVVASAKRKLYADSAAINRISLLLKHVAEKYAVDHSKFTLAGYDEAGNIALRYTELTYERPSMYVVQPKAVFGIDTPVDLFGLWHWAERQIKKNYWPGAVGDAKYYLDVMTKDNGTIYTNPEKYRRLSPFNRVDDTTGNEQYLKKIPVRLYYDTDIEWQLKNRRNSFYDTKMADGSELISRLQQAGNKEAEFIASKKPGVRSNGIRNPNSISIVDEVECIHWIKRCLDIFDANTWIPPYSLLTPAGWTTERFSLPPDFATQLTYKGVEDLRFPPGWGDKKSDEYWTYSFLWWLNDVPMINAGMLQTNLKFYYDGLVARNTTSGKPQPTIVSVKKISVALGDLETYTGTISMSDYHTQQPITLNCSIHVKECKTENHKAIYFELSPKPFTQAVWNKMNEIGNSFNGKE